MRLPRSLLNLVLCAAVLGLPLAVASAKTIRKVSHSYERVWPAAVRFLRIDEGLTIKEKDRDTGYILFVIEEEGQQFSGSLELVRRKDYSARDAVEFVLRIKDRPSYMEIAILNRLLIKLRKELGVPKAPAPKPPAPKDSPEDKSDAAQ